MNPQRVQINYTNWRGEARMRLIVPERIVFDVAPPWHIEPQWLLVAFDIGKGEVRHFAMAGIASWEPLPPLPPLSPPSGRAA